MFAQAGDATKSSICLLRNHARSTGRNFARVGLYCVSGLNAVNEGLATLESVRFLFATKRLGSLSLAS